MTTGADTFGHGGRILTVDLGSGQVDVECTGAAFARAFLGGNGFAAKLIHDRSPAGVAALAPDSVIVFAVGPLTGTPVWGTSRGHVAAISPQTGWFADSNFGGDFAVAQKRTGFDAICIRGRSARPVYLLVTEEGAELCAADAVWGTDTEATNRALEATAGAGAVAASIGPAGENGVVFANIICGGRRPGAAGRGGLGAVMGSKNLKAVVARGGRATAIAREPELRAFLREKVGNLRETTAVLTNAGTPFLVTMLNSRGMLCTHNASRETFVHAADIGSDVIRENYVVRNCACHGCPVACGKTVRIPRGEYAGRDMKMPEYESIYAMGPMLDNGDIVSIMNGNGVCDLMGMDTISMGVTMAFVAECLEKGVVSATALGGDVAFGDGPGMVELIKATSQRAGVGELLALGSERLAQRFGAASRELLYSVKGLEIPGHSARGVRPMALGYATSTRGGSHHDTRPKYPDPGCDPGFAGQVEHSVSSQNFTAVGDSLVMCRFTEERGFGSANNEALATVLNHVTCWDMTVAELERIGERIYNLERLINTGRGLRRRHDTLPLRTMHKPIPDGPAKGRYCPPGDLSRMLDDYYHLRGWDADGVPTPGKLAELGLV